MNKSSHFSGQPIFSQLIKLIPKDIVQKAVQKHCADRYYKKFNTWHHLITMLFACHGNCTSLREVVTGMRAFEGRLLSSGIRYFPARSTFSEANERRSCEVFEDIYLSLKAYWDQFLPDSTHSENQLYIIDSTVITLFQEIFKGSGSSYTDGRRKGGLKVHMAVPVNQQCPCVIHIGEGAANDLSFHKYLTLPAGSTVIMDRGYRSYPQFNLWTYMNIRWITRLWDSTHFNITKKRSIDRDQQQMGILEDVEATLGYPQKKTESVKARIITYIDRQSKKHLEF